MEQRYGYTILEVTIAMFVAAIISYALYTAFLNIMRSREGVISRSAYVTRVPLIYHQMARDIYGLYVPEAAIEDFVYQRQASQDQESQEDQAEQKKHPLSADNAFLIAYDGDRVRYLSGITSNPLTREHTPNRVRFIYRLVSDEDKESATLYRYQSSDITQQPDDIMQAQAGVAMLSGVTSMQVTMYVTQQQEQTGNGVSQQQANTASQEQESTQQSEQQAVQYRQVQEWPEKDQEGWPRHLIPAYMTIEVTATDRYDRTFDETYLFSIPAFEGVHHIYTDLFEQQQQQSQQTSQKQTTQQKTQLQQQEQQTDGQQERSGQPQASAGQQAGQQKKRRVMVMPSPHAITSHTRTS